MVRGLFTAMLVAFVPWLGASSAWAQNNDNFANARSLFYGTLDNTVSNGSGTEEVGESLTARGAADRNACLYNGNSSTYSQAERTFWWALVGTGRPITVTTQGSTFDTHLGIFPGGLNDTAAACLDAGTGLTETLTFNSAAGHVYRIQVGNCAVNTLVGGCSSTETGTIHLRATSPGPANDNLAAAATLPTGQAIGGDNFAATEEAGENVACGAQAYGRTVWYRWRAPARGSALITVPDALAAVAVYSNAGALIGCDAAPGSDARLAFKVAPGDYLVQVGGVGAHAGLAGDSAQGPFSVQATLTELADRDGDGTVNANDCRPDDPAIHPGAHDVPRNGVDEDCVGGDAPYTRIAASGKATWLFYPGYTRLSSLRATDVPAGARVQVRCRGRSCPFKRARSKRVRRARKRVEMATAKVKRTEIRPVTTFELRITAPRHVGVVVTWRFTRLRHDPVRRIRCLPPGKRKPRRC
jgi:hypothetical protein